MYEMDYRAAWDRWRRKADTATRQELETLSEAQREERFYCGLAFGTGGIRGETGVGSNRVNRYTIRQAAAGTARWLQSTLPAEELKKGVLIAFDTRTDSAAFALEAAMSICSFAIPAYLFDDPAPVPLLSFTLKREDYLCGIAITASHNPSNHNGFKLYNRQGGQLVPTEAAKIALYIKNTDPFAIAPHSESKIKQLLHFTGKAENAAYLSAITRLKVKDSPLTVVATPLHGAAKRLLPAALKGTGHHVLSVPAQEICDGTFATVTTPNPEDPAVFAWAEKVGYENHADLLFATDPDGDRCGVAVKDHHGYTPLSGNEVGALLIDYLLRRDAGHLPADAYIVKTVVSGDLGVKVAAHHNVATRITPTGFKYIGEALLKKENGTFLAGYEESGGFLAGSHAADKDGIFTAVLLAEAAAFYKKRNMTLLNAVNALYAVYGYEKSETETFLFPGKDGAQRKAACLRFFEEQEQNQTGADRREKVAGDTLLFYFGEGIRTALRPSGTEPKLKLYFTVSGDDEKDADAKLARIKDRFLPLIAAFLPKNSNVPYSANNGVER
mgnify:CR=1 FL=1